MKVKFLIILLISFKEKFAMYSAQNHKYPAIAECRLKVDKNKLNDHYCEFFLYLGDAELKLANVPRCSVGLIY